MCFVSTRHTFGMPPIRAVVTRRVTKGFSYRGNPLTPTAMTEDEEDPLEDLPGDVGDDRRKFVRVTLGSGERIEHGGVYFRYSADEFIVSDEESFPEDDRTRYEKADVARVEVIQHHPKCFITTAVADDDRALDALRSFRDGPLARTPVGRGLVGLYYAVSPPVAATLARHPDARTARAVRWLVERCARLVRRRDRLGSPAGRALISMLVTLLYLVGVALAAAGSLAIRARERRSAGGATAGRKTG